MSSPPFYVLGAFAGTRDVLEQDCRCGSPATHGAVALVRGEVIVVAVCEVHASIVAALPIVQCTSDRAAALAVERGPGPGPGIDRPRVWATRLPGPWLAQRGDEV